MNEWLIKIGARECKFYFSQFSFLGWDERIFLGGWHINYVVVSEHEIPLHTARPAARESEKLTEKSDPENQLRFIRAGLKINLAGSRFN